MDEVSIIDIAPQVIGGVILIIFGFAFRSWAGALEKTGGNMSKAMGEVLSKLDKMATDFQLHRLDVERRLVRMETEVHQLLVKNNMNGKNNRMEKK